MRRYGCTFDHIDHNPLNNQNNNLRECSVFQNMMNRRKAGGKVSKYKGVTFDITTGKWMARCTAYYKVYRRKGFKTENEAALAYNELAAKHHGEFAVLNVIQPLTER